jgi:hypothetical protein
VEERRERKKHEQKFHAKSGATFETAALKTSVLKDPVVAQTIGDLENGRDIEAARVTQVFDSIRLHIDDRSVREMRGYAHPPDIVKAVMMGCVSMAKGVACKDFDDARRLATSHLLQEIMDCDYHDLPGDADYKLLKRSVKIVLDEKLPPVTERWKYLGVREIVMKVEKSSAAAATLLVWFYVVTNLAHRELGGDHDTTMDLTELAQASDDSKAFRASTTRNKSHWENSNAVTRAGILNPSAPAASFAPAEPKLSTTQQEQSTDNAQEEVSQPTEPIAPIDLDLAQEEISQPTEPVAPLDLQG